MDSLSNWHRYVDQVSRPARRDESSDTPGWRPWKPTQDAPEVEPAVQPDAIPDLAAALGVKGAVETAHAATTEYRDPTVHDVLEPIPTFSAPRLRAPTFELMAPRIRPNGMPDPGFVEAEPSLLSPERDEPRDVAPYQESPSPDVSQELFEPASGEVDSLAEGGVDAGNGKVEPLRYWDLLFQIRSHDVAQNSYKSTFRETREELVQRLLDPPLTLEETARLLGVCPTTVRRYTNKGHLRHFRTTGNQRRFRLSDVLEFLESRASEIAADAQADRDAGHEA